MGNSVIYRPAYDAEVEYLESTGTQWIDTNFRPDSMTTSFELDISFEGQFVYDGTKKNIIKTSATESSTQRFSMNFGDRSVEGNEIFLWFGTAYDGHTVPNSLKEVALTRGIFSYSQGIGSYNGKSVNLNNSEYPPVAGRREGTMLILKDFKCYNARLYGAKIWDNNVLVRDFIPVRIGSTGYMYDKVSKQLFANKGTGNFILGNDVVNAVIPQQRCVLYFGSQRSVVFERIYEEYEWLVGDGSAYINTKVKLHFATDSVYIKGSKNGVATNKARFFGNYSGGENAKSLELIYYTSVQNDTVSKPFVTDGRFGINPSSEFEFYTTPFSSTTSVSVVYDNIDMIFNVNLDDSYLSYEASNDLILLNTNDTRYCMKVDVANFKVMRSSTIILNLIPCKLLQSIPAILDGNGIARQAGECGMWDKVSNKFYGNVANSGTFTVKGPKCYEEYKWLNCYTADGATLPAQGADIGITPISLTNKVLTIELGQISRNVVIYGTSPYLIPMWCMYVNNMYVMLVQERKGNDNTIHNMTYNWTTSNTITLDFINNVATLGNSTFQIEGTGYTFRGFNSAIWQNPRTVGRIKISDELDLVPCKLTHGIPASMDANGISRPAGTCGMWDKVNDVFYGNVANSGSFTVSND